MLKPLVLFIAIVSIFNGCANSTEGNLELRDVIEGIWWYPEKDTTYSEVVITDKVYWGYDDSFGVISYDYE